MDNWLHVTLQYIEKASLSSFFQLVAILGPLLFLSLLMHYLSLATEKISYKLFGVKGYLYVFGWLGTSLHELGHAIFALLFGHRITEMKLFKPDKETGTLGYVKHTYNKNNIFHLVGNFFIGIGPILLGTFFIFLLSFFLFKAQYFLGIGSNNNAR
jgi:hypothetical protein